MAYTMLTRTANIEIEIAKFIWLPRTNTSVIQSSHKIKANNLPFPQDAFRIEASLPECLLLWSMGGNTDMPIHETVAAKIATKSATPNHDANNIRAIEMITIPAKDEIQPK